MQDLDYAASKPLPSNVVHCLNALTLRRVGKMAASSTLFKVSVLADLRSLGGIGDGGGGTLVPHEVCCSALHVGLSPEMPTYLMSLS